MAERASEAVADRFVAAIEAAFEPVCHILLAAAAREHLAPGLRVVFLCDLLQAASRRDCHHSFATRRA